MITISNLSNKKKGNSFTFADLHLDLAVTQTSNNVKNRDIVAGNDLVLDTDAGAIFNSIRNIMTQNRYLTPGFSNKLAQFIGTPVSHMAAQAIGDAIDKAIVLFEPRVQVTRILVAAVPETNSYNITIFLTLPNFNTVPMMLSGILSNAGTFSFINR